MSMSSLKSSKTMKSSQTKSGTTHGYTMLMIRVEEGDLAEVKTALQKYPNEGVNDQNKHGLTALSLAARSGNYPIAEYLLSQGADVNLPNKSNQTPLFIACSYDHLEMAKLLLKHGANANIADTRGWTPLMSGCQNSNVALVELLLQNNADVRPIDRFGKRARERTKNPKITLLLDEMEKKIEMLEESSEYIAQQKNTSRSRSRGSISRRSLNELPLDSGRGDPMSLTRLQDELGSFQDLDSTLRACPQFVSDMEIYKMHKRAGYYNYHKSGDPRKLTSGTALKRDKKDRSFQSLFNRSGNDLLTASSRGRPLTNREKGNSKKGNGPDSTHSLKTTATPYATLNTDSSYEKTKSARRQDVIDALLKDYRKKPTTAKSVGSLEEDHKYKSVLKSPKRRILDELNLSVNEENGDDNDEVLNDELKDLFRLFVKKLADRTQKVMHKKVNNKVNQETEENGPLSEDKLLELISEVGEDLEDKTINSFKTLIADLMVSFDLDDNLGNVLEQGTKALVNRVTALAEDQTYQNITKQGSSEPLPQGELYNIIPSLKDVLTNEIQDKEGKNGVNQLRADVQDKIDEIFDLINQAFSDKSEKEKEELLNKLRPEIIGTLDALKSRVNKILQSQSDLDVKEQDDSDEIDIVMVDHAKPYKNTHESLNELDLADTTALRSTNPTLDTLIHESKKSAIKVQNICAGDVESDQSSPVPVNVDTSYVVEKQIIHAGEVESDKQSPVTIDDEELKNNNLAIVQEGLLLNGNDDTENQTSNLEEAQEEQNERRIADQAARNTDESINERDEDLDNQEDEHERIYEESEMFMRRGTEEGGEGFFERTITRESEVLYTLEDGSGLTQQLADTEAYIKKERETLGLLERTITRDSEVLYRFDEESQVQEDKNYPRSSEGTHNSEKETENVKSLFHKEAEEKEETNETLNQNKDAIEIIEELEEKAQELREAEEESRRENSNENILQKESGVEDDQVISKPEIQDDNLIQKESTEAQENVKSDDKQSEDEVNEVIVERDTTIEDVKEREANERTVEIADDANNLNKSPVVEASNENVIQKEIEAEDNQVNNKPEIQEDNLLQKESVEAQEKIESDDKQNEDEEVHEVVFEREFTFEDVKGRRTIIRPDEIEDDTNNLNKSSAVEEASDNQDLENQPQLANKNVDNNADQTMAIGKEPIQNLGKATITQHTLNDTYKPLNNKTHFAIPKPSPSKFVKEVVKMRIDEIPFCENFHYPGQSKLRKQTITRPKRILKETSVMFEEMTVVKAVN